MGLSSAAVDLDAEALGARGRRIGDGWSVSAVAGTPRFASSCAINALRLVGGEADGESVKAAPASLAPRRASSSTSRRGLGSSFASGAKLSDSEKAVEDRCDVPRACVSSMPLNREAPLRPRDELFTKPTLPGVKPADDQPRGRMRAMLRGVCIGLVDLPEFASSSMRFTRRRPAASAARCARRVASSGVLRIAEGSMPADATSICAASLPLL